MSQCLRCSKSCDATSIFCESCQSLFRNQLWQQAKTNVEATTITPPSVSVPAEGKVSGDPLERITSSEPLAITPPHLPIVEPPVSAQVTLETYNNEPSIDHAFHQLSEAAQHMTDGERNHRTPRASRLAPMYDISADIQRHSTPLPKVSKVQESTQNEDLAKYDTLVSKVQESTQNEDLAKYDTLVSKVQESTQNEDLARHIPDHWPWLQEAEIDDDENDIWSNSTDPLMARHFPNSAEVARIEEEDVKRAIADGMVTVPLMKRHVAAPHRNKRNIRTAITVFIILAIVFLVVDSVLVLAVFTHPHRTSSAFNGPPSLILSANVATVGQTMTLHIRHFSSNSRVLLTHDIQENVQIVNGSPLVNVGSDGAADVSMLVDTSCGPGFHTIEAEDVATRYTASATLQIAGAGPSRPSHLLIDTTTLDLGADIQGANTLQTLILHNSGGGSMSWSASSNQSWLLLSPTEGVFSTSQTITVAVERANLKPGDYKGTIAFSSNVGTLEWVRVSMTVRPLPPNVGAVLQITPPVLSLTD